MGWMHRVAWASTFVAGIGQVPLARSQTPTYRVERIASGLRQPIYMDQAPGDPAHVIYYMTRTTAGGANAGSGTHGSLWRYDMETRAATEVLNLSHRSLTLDLGPQGFAFHPDFNTPGAPGYQKFYVSSAVSGGPTNFVEEFVASGPNGTVPVNSGTGQPLVNRLVMQYTNVFADSNHVIDWIGFDPRAYTAPVGSPERNYLYVSAGDGSNGRPAPDRPEQKANSLQGKLLRLDVDPAQPDFYPADPLKNFAIPASNPVPLWNSTHGPNDQLVGTTLNYASPTETLSYAPVLPEIYFTGTRNQFRMSQDMLTGDFYAGDVGENIREEINFLPADPYDGSQLPYDFGYPQREGTVNGASRTSGSTSITWNLSGGGTAVAASVNPIQEGPHAFVNSGSTAGDVEIRNLNRSAYIGGYVYRGPIAELQGNYFYSDFVHGNIFSLDFDPQTPVASFSGANLNQVEVQPGVLAASLGTREVVLNRNLNSLWHTIMVDPQDPSYTPALGAAFGIGRVVSFGEDNAGNLYVVDMGGMRGNSGFNNDYPAGATGQIFRLTPVLQQLDVRVTVNRDTGAITLQNLTGAPVELTGYSIASTRGAIDGAAMIPVTGHYDAPIPPGDGSVDGNDPWQITSNSPALFSEATTGDRGTLAVGASMALGGAGSWIQSPYEDWSLQLQLAGGATALGQVVFVGNGGQPFSRSDLDFNGMLEPADWLLFRGDFFGEFPGLSDAQSYQQGDLNGDGLNNFDDFRLFQSDYVTANGPEAFQSLLEAPEPTSLTLAAVVGAALARRGRRRGQGSTPRPEACALRLIVGGKLARRRLAAAKFSHRGTPLANPPRQGKGTGTSWSPRREDASSLRPPRLLIALSALLLTATVGSPARAALKHKYTFEQGANDSVGTAHGTLLGNAVVAGGSLVLPGGVGDHASLAAAQIDLASYTDLTIESWFTVDNHQTWQRLFDFGDRDGPAAGQGYLYYAPQGGGGGGLGVYATLGNRTEAAHGLPAAGQQHHLAFVIDDNANGGSDLLSIYLDGTLASSVAHTKSLSNVLETYAYLGRSLVAVDPFFDGSIEEFRIHDNAFTLADAQASFAQGPTRLTRLVVNSVTGEASLVTDGAAPTAFDYYEIRSSGGALATSTWTSLDDQNFDPDGPGVGQGWEEADQSDPFHVAEFFLLGSSQLAAGDPLDLGRPFNPLTFGAGSPGDLTVKLGLQGGGSTVVSVEYVAPATYADFNLDGTVDGQDLLLWQRGLGLTTGAALADGDADFDRDVDAADLALWQSAWGSTTFARAAAQTAVAPLPEPAAAYAAGLAALAVRRRLREAE